MAVTETAVPKTKAAKATKAKYIGEPLGTPVTRGVDHLALVTDDMAETWSSIPRSWACSSCMSVACPTHRTGASRPMKTCDTI